HSRHPESWRKANPTSSSWALYDRMMSRAAGMLFVSQFNPAVSNRPADGGGNRSTWAFDRPPQDFVQLEIVDPVVLAEIHLFRALGRVGQPRIDGVQIDPRRNVRVGRHIGFGSKRLEHRRGGGVELAQWREPEDQFDRPQHPGRAVLRTVEMLPPDMRTDHQA